MIISLQIFSPGKAVVYKGKNYTVDFVTVSGYKLLVKLKELNDRVEYEHLSCVPTIYKIGQQTDT